MSIYDGPLFNWNINFSGFVSENLYHKYVCKKKTVVYLLIEINVPENESIWNESKYAPNKKPNTGPKAAMLYIQPSGWINVI